MTHAGGVQMLMEKLKQLLINCNDVPSINNPEIIRERPQFQLLYDELGSMIQLLFVDQHIIQDLERVNDLKKRFTDAAEEAEYLVDLFLSGVNKRRSRRSFKSVIHMFLSCVHIRNNNPSLNLDDVRRSFKSLQEEFMSMRTVGMKMDGSSPRPDRTTLNQPAAASQSSTSKNSLGSKKLSDEIVVGFDRDVGLIRDKLVEDQKKLDVVCIVGMGGIGKTTLARKVFNDDYVKHHFHVRVWVTVSQTYDKQGVLIQILESIRDQLDLKKASDSELRGLVHKRLMGKRYLIVIDDIWDIETWDNLKLFFPHDNNGSRLLLTSRQIEVAKHANLDGLIHHIGYLSKEKSWELLCQKVFQGNECPEWSIKPGMRIVETCRGLPLAVVVIAGVLAKEAWSEKFWVEIAERTGSYIVGDQNGCMRTLGLSYNHLPPHLRECFLYLGGFPEDYKFQVQRLIWLWVAEGFIQQAGDQSLEDIAEGYLMDLIDRNLVIVEERSKSNGDVKECKVHDLVRELCVSKGMEEQFILQTERLKLSIEFSNVTTRPFKAVRMFVKKEINILHSPYLSAQNLRSILFLRYYWSSSDADAKYFRSFVLLRVLDLQTHVLNDFPKVMELLVHLKYIAICISSKAGFPYSICNLWGLQTLIYTTEHYCIDLPSNISDLVSLRHLWSYFPFTSKKVPFLLASIEKPMNLQIISHAELENEVDSFQKCFPYIKELICIIYSEKHCDFRSLTYLEKLNLRGPDRIKNHITFPATLKTLKLAWCGLQWSDMSTIQSLPNLQVLKLNCDAFKGSCWNTFEQEFRQLKFLRLEWSDIKQWEAYSPSFPCLKRLEIFSCKDLEEIPQEIGDIPTLKLMKLKYCSRSAHESVRRIQQEQYDLGNYDLKLIF